MSQPAAVSAAMLALILASQGCRNRAYSDLYIENMAAEIRDLEDQCYEYDYEYRLLEQELATLRAENSQLKHSDLGQSSVQEVPPTQHQPLEFHSPSSPVPAPIESSGAEEVYPQEGSILEGSPTLPEDTGNGSADTDSSAPSDGFSPSSGTLPPSRNTPESPFRRLQDQDGSTGGGGGGSDFDIEGLVPPTIDPGQPMPPPLPVQAETVGNSRGPRNALERNLSQVEIPAQLASQSKPATSTLKADESNRISIDDSPRGTTKDGNAAEGASASQPLQLEPGYATIKPATQQLTDTRIVELAFHPTLSRAANFDDESDDDGLYLVLQPLNESGQVVPVAASLAVVILDPSREGAAARIGRRDYSATEVKAKMQPLGTNQGIHLRMPWNGPDPGADRVLVFARYTFKDGRQVIGQKEFFVSKDTGLRTVWAPRAKNRNVTGGGISSDEQVRTASHHATIPNTSSSPSSTNVSGTPTGNSNSNVVRPAVGTSNSSQAPAPSFVPRR